MRAPRWTLADLRYDPDSHTTSLPDGTDVPHVTHILGEVGLTTDFEEVAALGRRQARNVEYGRARGTAVHADCHAYDDDDLDWDAVDPAIRPYVEAWAELRADKALVPLRRERQVYHPVYHYTGFLDGVFRVDRPGENKRPLIDIKTGDPGDGAAHLQTAAYLEADRLAHPEAAATERWAVWLRPGRRIPYQIFDYTAAPDARLHFPVFLAALTVYRHQPARRPKVAV